MKRLCLTAILVGCSVIGLSAEPIKRIAFERDDGIWIVKPDGSGAKEIVVLAQSPDVSPDGGKIAYNTVQEEGKPAHRQIAIYDINAKGKITILTGISSDNALDPLWSPDGKKLLFNYYANNNCYIGLINADGTGFKNIPLHEKSYWGETWASDGTSFYADDMETIFQIDLSGKVLKKWKIAKLAPKGSMSGDDRMDASPDGNYLLMDVEMDEPAWEGWDGPPASIWELNLKTDVAKRLTPPALYAWDCHWFKAPDSILCCSQRPKDETQSIYFMSTLNGGADKKPIIRDGLLPSTYK